VENASAKLPPFSATLYSDVLALIELRTVPAVPVVTTISRIRHHHRKALLLPNWDEPNVIPDIAVEPTMACKENDVLPACVIVPLPNASSS
jgi:hypothetical protein